MFRLVYWIISICLLLGLAGTLVDATREMMGLAAHAHQHDQLSYSKFTRELWGPKRPHKKQENL